MIIPSHPDAFEVLCLQAADNGRGEALFGSSLARARKAARPFMVGNSFPSVYLEFPLAGDPFLDVTVLLEDLAPGTRIASPAAAGTDAMLDWFAVECAGMQNVCCGFELDTKNPMLPEAAIHFQPREHKELVEPFCKAIGEPERARLYLDLAERMPKGWPLSFFGLFRGRPDAPLRVCGYLNDTERTACAQDPARIAEVFESVGFTAYDDGLLARTSSLLAAAPGTTDFQFDIFDDGHLGPTFALDIQFDSKQPEVVRESFKNGSAAHVMELLEGWGAADGRWRLAGEAAFARSIDVELDNNTTGRFAFTLIPSWVKARWTACAQQPSKLYHQAIAKLLA